MESGATPETATPAPAEAPSATPAAPVENSTTPETTSTEKKSGGILGFFKKMMGGKENDAKVEENISELAPTAAQPQDLVDSQVKMPEDKPTQSPDAPKAA